MMIDHLFLKHPRSLGESYGAHAATAAQFGTTMIAGGLACLVHALIPALFTRTGSTTVKRLYLRMKERQPAFTAHPPAFTQSEWQLDYEI